MVPLASEMKTQSLCLSQEFRSFRAASLRGPKSRAAVQVQHATEDGDGSGMRTGVSSGNGRQDGASQHPVRMPVPEYCAGCGVRMQSHDTEAPG